MNKVYVSYYGDSISIVEGRYKHDKDKFYVKNFNVFSIEDIAQDFSKEKYALLRYALENVKLKSRHVVFCLNTRDVILKPQKYGQKGFRWIYEARDGRNDGFGVR